LKVLKESRGSKAPAHHMASQALSNRVTLEIKAAFIRQRMGCRRGGHPPVNERRWLANRRHWCGRRWGRPL